MRIHKIIAMLGKLMGFGLLALLLTLLYMPTVSANSLLEVSAKVSRLDGSTLEVKIKIGDADSDFYYECFAYGLSDNGVDWDIDVSDPEEEVERNIHFEEEQCNLSLNLASAIAGQALDEMETGNGDGNKREFFQLTNFPEDGVFPEFIVLVMEGGLGEGTSAMNNLDNQLSTIKSKREQGKIPDVKPGHGKKMGDKARCRTETRNERDKRIAEEIKSGKIAIAPAKTMSMAMRKRTRYFFSRMISIAFTTLPSY